MTWAHHHLALDVACQVHGSCEVVAEAAWRLCRALEVPFDGSHRFVVEIRRMTGRGGTVYVDRTGVAGALPILFDVAPHEVMALAAAIDLMPLRCWCEICDRRLASLESWMDGKGVPEDKRLWIILKKQREIAVPAMLGVIAEKVGAHEVEAA